MKTIYKISTVKRILLLATMAIIGTSSCGDDDFRILQEPLQQHNITGVAPSLSDIGTTVVITGANFSPVRGNNRVSFNGTNAIVDAATETELTVTVPEGATSGPITVAIGQLTASGPQFMVVPAPNITGLSSFTGADGDEIVIIGENFSATPAENMVFFNGSAATVNAATPTEITTTVPDSALTGPISVTVFGQEDSIDGFQVTPSISAIDPLTSEQLSEITITGLNFSTIVEENIVTIDGTEAQITEATSTSLTVVVPLEAVNPGAITVSVNGQIVTSEMIFTPIALDPAIDSFDPMTAERLTEITITGSNFSANASDNIVAIAGVEATVLSATISELVVLVPGDVTAPGPITVDINGRIATSADDFTPIIDETMVTIPIAVEEDDVEESRVTGEMNLTSGDLEMAEVDTGAFEPAGDGLTNIGLRFTNIQIPAGSTIISANIQFTADNTGADPAEVTFFGEAVGDAAPYTETAGDLSARTLTTANVVWDIPEWVTEADSGPAQLSPDIASILQEIIDGSEWSSRNSLNIIIQPSGDSLNETETNGGREAEGFNNTNPSFGARLIIQYQ